MKAIPFSITRTGVGVMRSLMVSHNAVSQLTKLNAQRGGTGGAIRYSYRQLQGVDPRTHFKAVAAKP